METSSDHEELRGLDLVLRHVCNKPVEVSSVTNALYSLLISQRHKISRVSKICLQYLLQEVSADNVLDIIVTVASFTSLCTCPRHEGSQYDHGAAHDNEANEVLELFEDLSRSCLKTIDKNAVEVLKDEKFLLLSPKMVEFIVRRDTLCIHSEMTVIIALNKWSQYRCSLKKLEPTTRNKVKMLDGILHQVRWLTLSPFELQMSQAKFSLLSRREVDAISRVMEHSNCSCPLPARLQRHRGKMSSPRCGPQHFKVSLDNKTPRPPEVVHSRAAGLSTDTTENIYEVIEHHGGRKLRAAETIHSCLHLNSRSNKKYQPLDSSNECILTDEEEDKNGAFNKIIFCFSCLCD